MNKHIHFFIAFVLAWSSLLGQADSPVNPDGYIPCYTVEVDQMLRSQNPNMETVAQFEEWLDTKMREAELNGTAYSRMVFTIPVIVHIVHEGEAVGQGYNLSQAQIESQIDVLNEDYRRMMGTPGWNNDPDGADCELEFCLAFVDSAGHEMPERGIRRVSRTALGLRSPFQTSTNDGFTGTYINASVSPRLIWDPYRYMNIFVVPQIEREASNPGPGQIVGFTRNPNTALPDLIGGFTFGDNNDGFVVWARAFGRVGNLSGGVGSGRTATHEIGHWLGLHHPWGATNAATTCANDDYCADTPQKTQWTFGCFDEMQCGAPNMFRNYMDYTDGVCQNIFSNCQKTRVRTVMMNSPRRKELLDSDVCDVPTVAAMPTISYEILDSCSGKVVFRETSGTIPTNWFWTFGDGSTSTNRRPVYTYGTGGTYTVRLVANNFLGSGNTSITVDIPSSGNPSIDVGDDISTCFGASVQLNAVLQDTTLSVRWSPTTGLDDPNSKTPVLTASNTRTYFVSATNANGCTGTDTILITVNVNPSVNVQNVSPIMAGNSVQLNAAGSASIVTWDWAPVFGFTSAINRPDPTVMPSQSVVYTVTATDANGCAATDDVVVQVDDTPFLSIDKDFETVGVLNFPYPNPASQTTTFSGTFLSAGDLSVRLFDIAGKQVQTVFEGNIAGGEFKHTWQRPVDAANGVYLVVWEKDGVRFTQKIQLF